MTSDFEEDIIFKKYNNPQSIDVIVQDNVLSSDSFDSLQKTMLNPLFPWFLGSVINPNISGVLCDDLDNYQLGHTFFSNHPKDCFPTKSPDAEILDPIISKMRVSAWKRIKANLNPRTSSIVKHGFHVDYQNDNHMKTSIFYVNSNDGYTEFEDGTIIESIANRLVTFPTNLKHTGTTCTNNPFRVVINFNYF